MIQSKSRSHKVIELVIAEFEEEKEGNIENPFYLKISSLECTFLQTLKVESMRGPARLILLFKCHVLNVLTCC